MILRNHVPCVCDHFIDQRFKGDDIVDTVTLTRRGAKIKGVQADFVPPVPHEVGLGDSIGVFPLTSSIADAEVRW